MTLFEVPDVPVSLQPAKETPDQRLTRRNRDALANGIHPATHRRLFIGTGETCGDCEHGHRYAWHNKSFWKCGRHRLGESHSAASDIRKSWPACVLFQVRSAS